MKLVSPVAQPRGGPRSGGAINNAVAQSAIWMFYRSDPERVVLKVGGFIKIRVKDLKILFEMLAGPEPV